MRLDARGDKKGARTGRVHARMESMKTAIDVLEAADQFINRHDGWFLHPGQDLHGYIISALQTLKTQRRDFFRSLNNAEVQRDATKLTRKARNLHAERFQYAVEAAMLALPVDSMAFSSTAIDPASGDLRVTSYKRLPFLGAEHREHLAKMQGNDADALRAKVAATLGSHDTAEDDAIIKEWHAWAHGLPCVKEGMTWAQAKEAISAAIKQGAALEARTSSVHVSQYLTEEARERLMNPPRQFKVGDRVRIARTFKRTPHGWDWSNFMNATLGSDGRIRDASGDGEVFKVGDWWYAPEALDIIAPAE